MGPEWSDRRSAQRRLQLQPSSPLLLLKGQYVICENTGNVDWIRDSLTATHCFLLAPLAVAPLPFFFEGKKEEKEALGQFDEERRDGSRRRKKLVTLPVCEPWVSTFAACAVHESAL